MAEIAFLGLGVMGSAMAANLARSGATVRGWNRTPDRPTVAQAAAAGVTIAPDLAAAVAEADLVFSCLGDVPDVQQVLLGAGGVAAAARTGALFVDFTTIGSVAAIELGTALRSLGFGFLDAPVSGGDVGAQRGTLTIMVGGELADFERSRPWLAPMGQTIRHCGPIGSGQAVKLCNQVLAAGHMLALCEALQLAAAQDLDPQLVIEVCSTGAAGSWALANLGPKILAEDLAPGFAIAHMQKDLRLVTEAAGHCALPVTELANQIFQRVSALDDGQGAQQGTQAAIRAYKTTIPK
ncbi:NAD(P)-dependent oxidoreductase [Limnothrix sp. FACHB-1083]|uniref:NAD(P)-dependent oxidoreductase n=1 Tax=unclassified Limnothrix TaxID=2632864 RepID=UPI001680EB2B|nr:MULTISPECIES: NAD(P)-dependent oxidoreductase [unclassified Limnothrix]MBD2159403.1 NAD(P)-dependent oxidoreductase [Limnothrix sp. FACHB-1083]MBD2193100.1 NAD(P)-dependent oxidoreductase [Limnothrix sp. FACHB-1088]